MTKIILTALLLLSPMMASAATFTTPSGVVVNENGSIVSVPISILLERLEMLQRQISALQAIIVPQPIATPPAYTPSHTRESCDYYEEGYFDGISHQECIRSAVEVHWSAPLWSGLIQTSCDARTWNASGGTTCISALVGNEDSFY